MAFIDREPTRQVHITRILGTNRAGEVLPDIWLDVERFELYAKVTQSAGGQYQKVISKFRWHDDPEDADEYRAEDDDGTARNTFVVKVCSPDEADLNDPEEWVPVRVIKAVHLVQGDDEGSDTNQKFITDDLTAERKVKARRVSHYDTSIDSEAEAAFDADPERRAYVAKADQYQKDDETKDDGQYIEYEIVIAINKQVSAHPQSFGTDQQVILSFKNDYLLDETDLAQLEEVGTNDKNPPYRLDPFQNIINVQWGLLETQWLLTSCPESFVHDGENLNNPSIRSKDDEINGAGRSGASGKGFTVKGMDYIAYGKITRDEAGKKVSRNVFMAANPDSGVVRIGSIVGGVINWTTVWTAPTPTPGGLENIIFACSYARDGFFISYKIDLFQTRFAVTKDGETFTEGVNAFAGLVSATDDLICSNVVYSKTAERYVTATDAYIHAPSDAYFHKSLITSTSEDGMIWTGQAQATSIYDGIGAQNQGYLRKAVHQSTVAAGNGVVVAAAGRKHTINGTPDYVLDSCAVAVSSNGEAWTVVALPGSVYQGSPVTGDYQGDATAVLFCKDKDASDDPEIDGYFIATGYEFGTLTTSGFASTSRMWRSLNGRTWTVLETDNSKVFTGLSAVAKDLATSEIITS